MTAGRPAACRLPDLEPESGLIRRMIEEVERDAKHRGHPHAEAEQHQYEEQHPSHHWVAPHRAQPRFGANPCGTVRCVRSAYWVVVNPTGGISA